MSNRVHFNLTKFVELGFDENGDLREEDTDYGYRIFDDYGMTYNNFMTLEEVKEIDEKKALTIIHETSFGDSNNDFTISLEHGFYFNGNWIAREDHEELFEKILFA